MDQNPSSSFLGALSYLLVFAMVKQRRIIVGTLVKQRRIKMKKKGAVLQIASDCTGLPTDRVALRRLALPFRYRFASESDAQVRKTLRQGSDAPELLYHDAKLKQPSRPRVDLYTSGFPCQPFSRAGRGLGWRDRRCLLATVTGYIAEKQPRSWILENVSGILNKKHRARVLSCPSTLCSKFKHANSLAPRETV